MSNYYVAGIPFSSELYHFGILGQKWGIRRYQNADGTLTAAGKERYYKKANKFYKTAESYNNEAEEARKILKDTVYKERESKANVAFYKTSIADNESKIDKYNKSGKFMRFFMKKPSSLKREIDELTQRISDEEYNLTLAAGYKNQYANMIDDMVRQYNEYRVKGDYWKSLADEGISRSAARRRK